MGGRGRDRVANKDASRAELGYAGYLEQEQEHDRSQGRPQRTQAPGHARLHSTRTIQTIYESGGRGRATGDCSIGAAARQAACAPPPRRPAWTKSAHCPGSRSLFTDPILILAWISGWAWRPALCYISNRKTVIPRRVGLMRTGRRHDTWPYGRAWHRRSRSAKVHPEIRRGGMGM